MTTQIASHRGSGRISADATIAAYPLNSVKLIDVEVFHLKTKQRRIIRLETLTDKFSTVMAILNVYFPKCGFIRSEDVLPENRDARPVDVSFLNGEVDIDPDRWGEE